MRMAPASNVGPAAVDEHTTPIANMDALCQFALSQG
jgi:hypothetical protein